MPSYLLGRQNRSQNQGGEFSSARLLLHNNLDLNVLGVINRRASNLLSAVPKL